MQSVITIEESQKVNNAMNRRSGYFQKEKKTKKKKRRKEDKNRKPHS
jgi:hypothetical protein